MSGSGAARGKYKRAVSLPQRLSYSRWTYGIEDMLKNVISGGLEKVNRTSSQFRISLVAYTVDAMKVRAKEVAVTKIMTPEIDNPRTRKEDEEKLKSAGQRSGGPVVIYLHESGLDG